MKFRFEAFSKIDLDSKTSNIFIDEDMLIINKIEPDESFMVTKLPFVKDISILKVSKYKLSKPKHDGVQK